MKYRNQIVALLFVLVAGCGGSGVSPIPNNTAPTISAIMDQSTSANISGMAIAFTVTDENTDALSYSVTSDNQQVIPDTGLTLVSNGGSGSITVTPIVDTLGDAFITIVVTDRAGLSGSTSFLLTIVPEQKSVQQFVRDEFAQVEDGQPALINAIAFDQDAENDDFADLLAQ